LKRTTKISWSLENKNELLFAPPNFYLHQENFSIPKLTSELWLSNERNTNIVKDRCQTILTHLLIK